MAPDTLTGKVHRSHEASSTEKPRGSVRRSKLLIIAGVVLASCVLIAGAFTRITQPGLLYSAEIAERYNELHVKKRASSPPSHLYHQAQDQKQLYAHKQAKNLAGTHVDAKDGQYLIGVGKADITGPVVEINMMGYAKPEQVGSGVRQRLYSRAFIVGDINRPEDRFIYLVLDTQAGDTAIRYGILAGLRNLGPTYAMYGHDSLAVTATHSHSGPGAWLNYLLPQITSKGFDKQSYQAIVDGCLLSIRRAHESLEPGFLTSGTTKVFGANLNRSLFSYLANPEEERARYNISAEDDGSNEKDLTLLKFQRASDGKNIGVLTWFPTHGTSMYANNTLITGDNKGLAADLFEKQVYQSDSAAEDFVAGFSQANMGDASPNTLGGWCDDGTGERCTFETSACSNGRSRLCHGRGPGFREADFGAASCYENARIQYTAALDLYNKLNQQQPNIRGTGVKAYHHFHNMTDFQFSLPNGSTVRTCSAALGYSFAAGTWDEPGDYDIVQHGTNASNASPGWKVISWLLKTPNKHQIDCHAPKPILLDVGEVFKPYHWTPNIVDIQTFRVGQFFIVVSSGEVTTMAGRRWKEAVAEKSKTLLRKELDGEEPVVVLGGPSNSYTHYITTEEEYNIQRYEGASTLYGPNTLAGHIDRTTALLYLLGNDRNPDEPSRKFGPLPPDNTNVSYSFITGVLFDGRPWDRQFGDTLVDVNKTNYNPGDTVSATFVGANPRNNLRLEETYAAVEQRRPGDSRWTTVRDDSDWALLYQWKRISKILGTSEVEISWTIENDVAPGEYRLRYFGDAKSISGKISAFEGTSKVFTIN